MGTTADQEKTTGEILEFLAAFGSNLKQLVTSLENNDLSKVNMPLYVMTEQDLGAHLTVIYSPSEPHCLERLVSPLKAIEADLSRAGTFASKVASPTLSIFVPSKLRVVQSVLTHLQKTRGGTSTAKMTTPSAPGVLDRPSKGRKKWWQFWK